MSENQSEIIIMQSKCILMIMFTETTAQTIESRAKDQKRPMTQDGLLAERGGGDVGQKRGKFNKVD
jgi:hypothetical protein